MATPSRSTYVFGPASIEFTYDPDGATLPTPVPKKIKFFAGENENFEIKPDVTLRKLAIHGVHIDDLVMDQIITADIPVDARLDAGRIAGLWPYLNVQGGEPLFTLYDRPLVIADNATTPRVYTMITAAITKMPSLNFSMAGPLIGPVTFTGLRGDAMGWATASSMMTIGTTGGTFADTTLINADLAKWHQPYTVAIGTLLGTTPYDIDTVDGVKVDFSVEFGKIETEANGTHQMFVKSVECAMKFIPAAQTYDKILPLLKLQDTGNTRGRSMAATAVACLVKGVNTAATHFTLYKGSIHTGSYRFGLQDNYLRDGEIAVVSSRPITSGVPTAIALIAVS